MIFVAFFADSFKPGAQPCVRAVVQRGERIVEYKDLRLARERTGD